MKFNVYLPEKTRIILEEQYREYIKCTPMTKKEQRAVREWVKDGHSVYENNAGGWDDDDSTSGESLLTSDFLEDIDEDLPFS